MAICDINLVFFNDFLVSFKKNFLSLSIPGSSVNESVCSLIFD
ncbi:MAG: hypothetical protein NZL96_00260 [Patescibacteria group bacterium]|nr:hypothetical protein [Patescibacteria group bacterium]